MAAGEPDSTPVVERVTPWGRPVAFHTKEPNPPAPVSCSRYLTPAMPSIKLLFAMVSGLVFKWKRYINAAIASRFTACSARYVLEPLASVQPVLMPVEASQAISL
ncbi:hypothetical protein D3C73_1317840 [compost metagenome]